MVEENTGPKGPSLGGPTSPNLGGSSGPSLGGGPQLEISKVEKSNLSSNTKPDSKISMTNKKVKIDIHSLLQKFKTTQRKVQRSLQILMSYEFKTKVTIASINIIYRTLMQEMFDGQLIYLQNMIDLISKGKDPLSKEMKSAKKKIRISTQVFETLIEIIQDEIDLFNEARPEIISPLSEQLKQHRDSRVEPRMCFWILMSTGFQLKQIESKEPKALGIVLEVIVHYKPALKRALGVFLLFCYHLADKLNPYPVEICETNLVAGPTKTGYNMASWIKYRYGTNSQTYIEYERFIIYFLRSFGKIPGNASSGPKVGYRNWINRALTSLEENLKQSSLIVDKSRGESLEGMLIGLKEELEDELLDKEFDDENKLINYPVGGEGAVKFLEWLFETAFNRRSTTNIASHGKVRLSLDMFEFITDTIRWTNEYGEQITVDWLSDETEDED